MSKIEWGFTFHTVPNRFFHKFEAFGKSSAFSGRYTYKILMRTTFWITQYEQRCFVFNNVDVQVTLMVTLNTKINALCLATIYMVILSLPFLILMGIPTLPDYVLHIYIFVWLTPTFVVMILVNVLKET